MPLDFAGPSLSSVPLPPAASSIPSRLSSHPRVSGFPAFPSLPDTDLSSFPPVGRFPQPSALPVSDPAAVPVGFPQAPVFQPPPPGLPDAPDFPFDDDPHNWSFESDVPFPPSSDYCRMLDSIITLFPQAKDVELSQKFSRSLFESIFPGSTGPVPPLPRFTVFERVSTALAEADERIAYVFHSKKSNVSLLPRRKSLYSATCLPAEGKALPLNASFEALLPKPLPSSRDISISLLECASLESSFRGQVEVFVSCHVGSYRSLGSYPTGGFHSKGSAIV